MSQFTRTENKQKIKNNKNNILVVKFVKELPAKKKKVQKLVKTYKKQIKNNPHHMYRSSERVWSSLYTYKCKFSNTEWANVTSSKDNEIK